jgi:hypothetical protein
MRRRRISPGPQRREHDVRPSPARTSTAAAPLEGVTEGGLRETLEGGEDRGGLTAALAAEWDGRFAAVRRNSPRHLATDPRRVLEITRLARPMLRNWR